MAIAARKAGVNIAEGHADLFMPELFGKPVCGMATGTIGLGLLEAVFFVMALPALE